MKKFGLLVLLIAALFPARADSQERRPPADAPGPERVTDLLSALAQTSAVVEARVESISYEVEFGAPWTLFELSEVTVHYGSLGIGASTYVVRILGGTYPGTRTTLGVCGQAELEAGERYVLFLWNSAWALSSYIPGYVFRVQEERDGRRRVHRRLGGRVWSVTERGVNAGALLDASRRARSAAEDLPALELREFIAQLGEVQDATGVRPNGPLYDLPSCALRESMGGRAPADCADGRTN